MKNERKHLGELIPTHGLGVAITFFILLAVAACTKTESTLSPSSSSQDDELRVSNDVQEINLVSDVEEYNPVFIDPNLVNAWGLAFDDEGEIWVSSADKGVSTVYGANGETLMPPVGIPFGGDDNGGAPTGVVYNETTDFVIPANGEVSEFIFATENGTIAAWNDEAGSEAITVADQSGVEAVYKGLALAKNNGANYLYATNFKQAKIDVFDASFNYVSMSFNDPTIPAGFAPFNIKYINGLLYVTYAKQLAPDNEDDEAGPGNGYVNVFNTDGSFVKRFASQGTLNSPWGIAQDPGTRGIMVGNFGDGRINVFNNFGTFLTYVKTNGQPLEIEGLWALVYPGDDLPQAQRSRFYFTAGPDEETHGVFGYLKKD